MPLLSPSMSEGTLVRWLKKEGDSVKAGEVIAEVETDKATMDLEAFDSGTLRKILVNAGSKVPVNSRIAVIGAPDEKIDEALLQASIKQEAKVEAKASPASSELKAVPPPLPIGPHLSSKQSGGQNQISVLNSPSSGRVKSSPLARKVAQEKGVDLSRLIGSGPSGRIVKRDVLAQNGHQVGNGWTLSSIGSIAKEERLPLSTMRQVIARRLVESKTQIPHFYVQVEIDAKPMLDLRSSLNPILGNQPQPIKFSLNDLILKGSAEAVRRVPIVNASFDGDAIQQHPDVHLSFAVAISEGLITPIIREAQNKNLKQIHLEAKSLIAKSKEGKLKLEEFTGGTFTISNLGMLGVDSFSAIINPPQAAILAVGNIVKKPVVDKNDQIVIGHRLNLTLSCDHRVVDGAVGAQFLKELRLLLENPAILLL